MSGSFVSTEALDSVGSTAMYTGMPSASRCEAVAALPPRTESGRSDQPDRYMRSKEPAKSVLAPALVDDFDVPFTDEPVMANCRTASAIASDI